jgi:hypothetical protein
MPRYEPTGTCPVCFSSAGAQETCADCGWLGTTASRLGSPTEAEERCHAEELERAQRRYDSVAAARISPASGRDLPYIRGGRPDEVEWATAVRAATVSADMLDTADHLREMVRQRVEELHAAGRLNIVEIGTAGIGTIVVSMDLVDMPRVIRRPIVPWTDLAPMLSAESPEELLFRLAGGLGGVDRARLWSMLDRTVPEATAIPAHHQILVCAAPGWPILERAFEVLARRYPEASRSRVTEVDVSKLVADQVSRFDEAATLRGKLELVVAHVLSETGRIVLRSELLFTVGAQMGNERALTVRCAHADNDGTVLAVVVWRPDGKPRAVSIDSVRLRPGLHRLRAVLAGPGRVKFVEPSGIVPDPRPWSQLMANLPERFVSPVGKFDLVCALDLGDDGLVGELVELLRHEYPENGRFRVAVVGYRAHEFRVGRENKKVVYGRWLDPPDEARRALGRFRAFAPGLTRAAPVEDALELIAGGVRRIPADRKVVLLTIGERPPHPPEEEPGGEIPCPHEYDWRSLLSSIQRHPGGQTSVAVLDSAEYLGNAWQRLGRTALHQLSMTDAGKLAMAAGLLITPAERLSFPLLHPTD